MKFTKANESAYTNFLRSKFEMWTGADQVRSYPAYMGIDPASACQLRCPLCPTGVENEKRKTDEKVTYRNRAFLTPELFDALMNEVGEYLFLVMFYNWGEPLLNKDLPQLIRKAKQYEIYTEINTNLSLPLSDQRLDDLLSAGIDDVAASIDGFSQGTYEIYRRGGDFELARSNLLRMVKARDRLGLKTKITWNFLVFSFNEHEVEEARHYCDSSGIVFNARDAFVDDPEWLPSYRRGTPVLSAIRNDIQENAASEKAPCAWHYNYTMFNADGSISPCCAPWDQKHDMGRFLPAEAGFAGVWNNDAYRKSRAVFDHRATEDLKHIETLCTKCPYNSFMQNLYSHLDAGVIEAYSRTLHGHDPAMDKAFELLSSRQAFVSFHEKTNPGMTRKSSALRYAAKLWSRFKEIS